MQCTSHAGCMLVDICVCRNSPPLSLGARYNTQDGASWNKAIKPKAWGAWHLHELSLRLPHCEQFVMFSSIVSSIGHQGVPFCC